MIECFTEYFIIGIYLCLTSCSLSPVTDSEFFSVLRFWTLVFTYVFAVAPYLLHASGNVVSTVGSVVRLECQFFAVPAPTVSWSKDSYALWSAEHLHVLGGTVVIGAVVTEDAGLYQCWADSDAGIEYAVIRLIVEPRLTTAFPILQPSGQ